MIKNIIIAVIMSSAVNGQVKIPVNGTTNATTGANATKPAAPSITPAAQNSTKPVSSP